VRPGGGFGVAGRRLTPLLRLIVTGLCVAAFVTILVLRSQPAPASGVRPSQFFTAATLVDVAAATQNAATTQAAATTQNDAAAATQNAATTQAAADAATTQSAANAATTNAASTNAATTIAASATAGATTGGTTTSPPLPLPRDHFLCYEVKEKETFTRRNVEIENQFGKVVYEVKKPALLCVPSSKQVLP
jgi:hypothetical protein